MAAAAPLLITRRHLTRVLPVVARELERWQERARAIPEPALRSQAEASLAHKRFHCEGGAVFAAWSLEERASLELVRFIVAFQTISDYLDNLCDRTESLNLVDFRRLHQSMLDAVGLVSRPGSRYYAHHPHKEDGGYLESLVAACREALAALPRYEAYRARITRLVRLYVDLQCYKHIEPERRVPALTEWFLRNTGGRTELFWWEFAAATGSTLGIFALAAEAARRAPYEAAERLEAAYFPWIAALHILLDYFIDQEEDRRENDLNFVSFYENAAQRDARLDWILRRALTEARGLSASPFHLAVVEGLLGLYLSNPKVRQQGLEAPARALLSRAGLRARLVYGVCRRFWRRTAGRPKPS